MRSGDVSEKTSPEEAQGPVREAPWQPLLLGADPPPPFEIERYRSCRTNRYLADVVKRICDGTGVPVPEILYLYGVPGVGKTHLLCAIAHALGPRALLVPVADLAAEIASARRQGFLAECYRFIMGFEVLLFDDVQYATRPADQMDLAHILDQLLRRHRTLVISATERPERLQLAVPDLVSVLAGGVVLNLSICDEEVRLSILRESFDEAALPDDIADYLAENVTDSIRRLKAAADQLIAMSRQTDTPVTTDMARAVIPLPEDLRPVSSPPPPRDGADDNGPSNEDRATLFREMLAAAENEEEQALALQIALGQRLREMRSGNGNEATIMKLEHALALLREGKLNDALEYAAGSVG